MSDSDKHKPSCPTWLLEDVAGLVHHYSRPIVIGISGHAAVGKTWLAQELVRRWPGSVRLETESCIFNIATRSQLNVSGCRLEAHDLELYASLISKLLDGQAIRFRSYDWQTRSRTGDWLEKRLSSSGILVLDGSIVPHPLISRYCDRIFFLSPTDFSQWVPFAVSRDINERFRSQQLAEAENRLKYADAAKIGNTYRAHISDFIMVSISASDGTQVLSLTNTSREACESLAP